MLASGAAQGTCSADATKSRFSVDPAISFPAPYTYCFKIKVNKCTAASSACCSNLTTSAFFVDVGKSRKRAVVFAGVHLR